ncbi:MAG TPA: hypothetical protein VGL44_15765 [Gaiellales bacterium]|jgi:hypothetical protein
MRVTRFPLVALATTVTLFVAGDVLGWITHDPQTAGGWGGGGPAALVAFSVALCTFGVAGALIASRHPRNSVGWLLIAIGFSWALDSALEGYAVYGLKTHPGSLPAAAYANALDDWLWVVSIGTMGTLLLQLFPDGRPLSPRWRPLAWVSGIAIAVTAASAMFSPGRMSDSAVPASPNPVGVAALGGLLSLTHNALSIAILCIPFSAVALLLRYRRSHGVERLQLKWLVSAAAAIVAFYMVVVSISGAPAGKVPLWLLVLQDAAVFAFCLIPLAIGAAVMRYRLYDIDMIVRRTVVYSALVAVLALVYVAAVSGLGWIGRTVTGQSGAVAVTVSTLLVAASFQPLRTRIQSAVDRRFYRGRYDAQVAVARFSSRLRSEVDLESLSGELIGLVDETLQPSRTTLWLRPAVRDQR